MNTELDEELIHLAKIGSVAMRIQQSGSRHRMPDINGNNIGAPTRWKFQNFNIFAMRERAKKQKTSKIISDELIGRWIRREEGELRRHG